MIITVRRRGERGRQGGGGWGCESPLPLEHLPTPPPPPPLLASKFIDDTHVTRGSWGPEPGLRGKGVRFGGRVSGGGGSMEAQGVPGRRKVWRWRLVRGWGSTISSLSLFRGVSSASPPPLLGLSRLPPFAPLHSPSPFSPLCVIFPLGMLSSSKEGS